MLIVAIDTASEIAGVALSEGADLVAEMTWRTHQNHSREILPTLDWLLSRSGKERRAIEALVVCTGPGSYAGLRVGISTAKALAYGLGAPVVGVGRLAAEADAYAFHQVRRVVSLHAAGRAELAFAAYERVEDDLREVSAPRLVRGPELLASVADGDIICGDHSQLPEEVRRTLREDRGCLFIERRESRVVSVSRLGAKRLDRGDIDSAESLVPLYLREPAIGPQPSVSR